MVYVFGVFGNASAADFAHDFEHFFIAVHGVGVVDGSIVELFGVGIVALAERHDFLHQGVVEVVLEGGVVVIVICHYFEFFL